MPLFPAFSLSPASSVSFRNGAGPTSRRPFFPQLHRSEICRGRYPRRARPVLTGFIKKRASRMRPTFVDRNFDSPCNFRRERVGGSALYAIKYTAISGHQDMAMRAPALGTATIIFASLLRRNISTLASLAYQLSSGCAIILHPPGGHLGALVVYRTHAHDAVVDYGWRRGRSSGACSMASRVIHREWSLTAHRRGRGPRSG